MNFVSVIEAKRDGQSLASGEIRDLVRACCAGETPDYQLAAFLMAVFFRGLDARETRDLTLAMRDSGETLKFPRESRPIVDKHSTGGVGDKVSLPLTPLLACLGFRVPMISGRGLGITGGTLDKLESIPGFRTALSPAEITRTVQRVGCVICGQTGRMAPADKALYALRDVTGTVPSIPLIVASILSKKLAESLNALVLDVKFGSAAFMPTKRKARELATELVTLGRACGVQTSAVLSRMDAPLGRAVGNWLEVKEAVACLENQGPDDLRRLVVECAARLLVSTGKCRALPNARAEATKCLAGGAPRQKWNEMLREQGANLKVFEAKLHLAAPAGTVSEMRANQDGWVVRCDARTIGEVVRDMGGGRITRESVLNLDVGVEILGKPGSRIEKGAPLLRIHARSTSDATAAARRLKTAITISKRAVRVKPLLEGSTS